MLLTIGVTAYMTLTYVVGVKCFNLTGESFESYTIEKKYTRVAFWLLSPLTVPALFVVLLIVG